MKRIVSIVFALSLVFSMFQMGFAQDTLDVGQGYETLNLAIEGDTTAEGQPKNMNRVYRLERDGWYLLNGSIGNVKDAPLRIVAAKGAGARPALITAVDEIGGSARMFVVDGDAEWKGLYQTGINNLGNQGNKNNFQLDKEEGRYVMDDCFLDDDRQAFFRTNGLNLKLYITNTIMRNAERQADPWDGLMISARGGEQDTIFVQNCTFYIGTNRPIQTWGIMKNVIFDHCTFDKFGGVKDGGNFDFTRIVNLTFTNNLVTDVGFDGGRVITDLPEGVVDTFAVEVFGIDSINSILATDDERQIVSKNNVYGWSPEVTAWMDSKPERKLYEWNNLRTQMMIEGYPNMISENNIEEYPVYSDPTDMQTIIDYMEYRYSTNYSNEFNPTVWADRNGRSILTEDPTTAGLNADEFDFDYATSSAAYTHAEGGFPVGDLNWFPAKKAEWEVAATGIKNDPGVSIPAEFALEQNYPNPFNPTTTINYSLSTASKVRMTIYNALGQKVKVLLDNQSQKAGSHSIQWNGQDETGSFVSSGIYFYRLDTEKQTMSKKMLLLK